MPRRSGSKTPAEFVSGQVPRSVALMVPITPPVSQRTRKGWGTFSSIHIKPSPVSVPDWISLGIAQGKSAIQVIVNHHIYTARTETILLQYIYSKLSFCPIVINYLE